MDVSIEQLRRLPVDQRIHVIEELWDSLDESDLATWPIPDSVLDESDREFEAHLADPGSSIPWEEVRARLRERYG